MKYTNKIMILNILFHSGNTCSVTFLVKYNVKIKCFKGYIMLNVELDSNLFYNFNKYGRWIKNKYFELNKYLFIYVSPDNKLKFKNIKYNNFLVTGNYNRYNHKLIYKTIIK